MKNESFEYQRLKKLNSHLAKSLQAKKHTEMEEGSSFSRFKQKNNIPLADLTFRAPNNQLNADLDEPSIFYSSFSTIKNP